MAEPKLDQLSPRSQKSRFGPLIVAEASALADTFQKKKITPPLEVLEAHARSNVAHKLYEDRLRSELDIDPLTGALSRKAIMREIYEGMAEIDRNGGQLHVIFMDLDGLKTFNDTHGHKVGDVALQQLVQGVRGNIRPYDAMGRYGGDEFIALIKNGDAKPADRIMEGLHQNMSQLEKPFNNVRTTMGVANYKQGMVINRDELVFRADQAFYYAKSKKIAIPVTWNYTMRSIQIPK